MKKFLVLMLIMLSSLGMTQFVQAKSQYQPVIDRITNKIDLIYEQKGDDFIMKLEDRIEQILETPRSEKVTTILNALLDYTALKYSGQEDSLGITNLFDIKEDKEDKGYDSDDSDNYDDNSYGENESDDNYNSDTYKEANNRQEDSPSDISKPTHSNVGETNANTAEFKTIGYYNVVGDKIIFDTGVDSKTYRAIWDFFQKIIPADMRKTVTEFDGYADPDAWTAASVSKADSTNGVKWGLNVNTSMITKNGKVTDDGLELLIHEFGHVLTLAGDQMNHLDEENTALVKKTKDECKTFFVDSMSACIYKDSYLNKFINKFWSDKEYLHRTLTEATFNAREGHQTDFVSGYAASNPVEDIAESFAHFVLENKPTGKTIAEKKMLFFYDYPDFVRLRNHVLANK